MTYCCLNVYGMFFNLTGHDMYVAYSSSVPSSGQQFDSATTGAVPSRHLLVMCNSRGTTVTCTCCSLVFLAAWVFKCPVPHIWTTSLAEICSTLFVLGRVSISWHGPFPSFSAPDFSASILRVSDRPRGSFRSPRPRDLRFPSHSTTLFERLNRSTNPDPLERMLSEC